MKNAEELFDEVVNDEFEGLQKYKISICQMMELYAWQYHTSMRETEREQQELINKALGV